MIAIPYRISHRISRVSFSYFFFVIFSISSLGFSSFSQRLSSHYTNLPVWKVERDGITSYVMGTVPLSARSVYLPRYIQNLIGSRKYFLSNADPVTLRVTAQKFAEQMWSQMLAGKGPGDELGRSSPEWRYVQDVIRRLQINRSYIFVPFAALKAEATRIISRWMPSGMIAAALFVARSGGLQRKGRSLPDLLTKIAESQKRELVRLDDSAMISILDLIGTDQLKALIKILRSPASEQIDDFELMMQVLQTADPRKMAEITKEMEKQHREWVSEVERFHAQGGAVIAVDLASLVGRGGSVGLLGLLQDRGFEVSETQVLNDETCAGSLIGRLPEE